MKKLFILLFYLAGILPAVASYACPLRSVNMPKYLFIPPTGATSLAEISNAILLSLQSADAGQLSAYFPTDQELSVLRRQGSEDMRAVLEDQSASDLEKSFETDWQKVVQEGVTKTLNWSELQVTDTKAGKASRKNSMLLPVETVLQTKQNQPISLVFEVIKLKNRYYLFRGIQLKS